MKFVAYERTKQGTGASRRLRNAAKVPGIVYGAGTPTMIELDHNALFFALKKEAFHSSLLEMELAGKTQTVLLRDYSMHAFKPIVMHVDFQRIDEKTTLRKRVPLHFVNEEISEAVKTDKCVINKAMSEIEIECLATKLPEHITIDLADMKKGDTIHARDLKLDEGIKLVRHGRTNITIVSAVAPRVEAEEVEADATAAVAAAAPVAEAKGKAPAKEKQNKK
ncbi:MAG: 50S ribosomal protein L25/general stress protein Ctc [Burkholderiaceae bacterium]|nr:50S ribosomal protein L25/general stress protein Ctc [Burkholderiaceae bacterium]